MSRHDSANPTLNESERRALATLFASPTAARQLLLEAGFPPYRMPVMHGNSPYVFWYEVGELLAGGVLHNGRSRVLAAALRDFPENPVLLRAFSQHADPIAPNELAERADSSGLGDPVGLVDPGGLASGAGAEGGADLSPTMATGASRADAAAGAAGSSAGARWTVRQRGWPTATVLLLLVVLGLIVAWRMTEKGRGESPTSATPASAFSMAPAADAVPSLSDPSPPNPRTSPGPNGAPGQHITSDLADGAKPTRSDALRATGGISSAPSALSPPTKVPPVAPCVPSGSLGTRTIFPSLLGDEVSGVSIPSVSYQIRANGPNIVLHLAILRAGDIPAGQHLIVVYRADPYSRDIHQTPGYNQDFYKYKMYDDVKCSNWTQPYLGYAYAMGITYIARVMLVDQATLDYLESRKGSSNPGVGPDRLTDLGARVVTQFSIPTTGLGS
ncbi:effector-associated domain EAD1-containing protein [Frankia sp. AgPm24]|uniref:effector-associated domain EAD1-containing protein n=1 Tax=Frankia sp. AgPm24 TaxID=631128 RepID=UPI00200F4998|nr:effector-associated domain EAD1-containing protein [Frankia sp. AgPm24]MCK9925408.1 effector-associated domain EAD1-containing protein [Frankia sp. AgPm24]